MGPYYQHTSQGMGHFFDLFYEHPSLMAFFVIGTFAAGFYFWNKNKTK